MKLFWELWHRRSSVATTSTCIPDLNSLELIIDKDQIRMLPERTTPVVLDYGTAAAATLVRLIFDNNPDLRAATREALCWHGAG